jgi:type IV pilus assembly protein PilN
MMIRINLLPTRQVKKRGQSRPVIYLAAVLVLVALVGNYLWYSAREEASQKLETEISSLQRQIDEKKRILREVETINARRAEVEKKMAVLDALRAAKAGPVKMLDALSTAAVHNVWLKEFVQDTKGVKLTGTAVSNEDVAEFMRGLASIVWTPKGMGKLVEQRHGAKTSRVELLAGQGGAVEEFSVADIKPFFTAIDLNKSESKEQTTTNKVVQRRVEFELAMQANYGV